MSSEGFIQVALDGAGKKMASYAVNLPIGTIISNADGTTTILDSEATVYLEKVVLVTSGGKEVDMSKSKDTDELLWDIRELLKQLVIMQGGMA